MSFSVSDHEHTFQTHCPGCGAPIQESYVFIPCGHPGCGVRGCGDCLTRCEGDQFRCEDHFMTERVGSGNIFYTMADFKALLDADDLLICAATDPAVWAVA